MDVGYSIEGSGTVPVLKEERDDVLHNYRDTRIDDSIYFLVLIRDAPISEHFEKTSRKSKQYSILKTGHAAVATNSATCKESEKLTPKARTENEQNEAERKGRLMK